MIVLAVGLVLVALVLWGIGRWGYRNQHNLASRSLSEQGRANHAATLRRGAITLQVVAVVCLVVAVLSLFGVFPA